MLGAFLLALLVSAPTALALCCLVSFGARRTLAGRRILETREEPGHGFRPGLISSVFGNVPDAFDVVDDAVFRAGVQLLDLHDQADHRLLENHCVPRRPGKFHVRHMLADPVPGGHAGRASHARPAPSRNKSMGGKRLSTTTVPASRAKGRRSDAKGPTLASRGARPHSLPYCDEKSRTGSASSHQMIIARGSTTARSDLGSRTAPGTRTHRPGYSHPAPALVKSVRAEIACPEGARASAHRQSNEVDHG